MSQILPLGVSPDLLKIECSRPSSLNYPFFLSFIFILFCWFFFIESAFAQWVYFDESPSLGNNSDFNVVASYSGVFFGNWLSSLTDGSYLNDQFITFDPLLNKMVSYDLTLVAAPVPPRPPFGGSGLYSQAQLDVAVLAAASAGGGTPMTFAQGGEIAAAVASATLVAVGFGLVRKAMT